jgi:lysophospholipase L1-like esterase
MRNRLYAILLLAFSAGLPLLGGLVGARLAAHKLKQTPWQVPDHVRQRVQEWKQVETLAGAFAVRKLPIEGVEGCYYSAPPDLTRITWIGPDIPTPFVGFAPRPGPMTSGHINSMQFRYDREIACPKPAGVIRIFLVGGSTAYGAGATSNATTIGGYLERYLNEQASSDRRHEVVTAAASGWASTHERVLIENQIIELEPDLVLALTGHNDAHWSSAGRNTLNFRGFQDDYFQLLTRATVHQCGGEVIAADAVGPAAMVAPEVAARRLAWNVARSRAALEAVGCDYVVALQPILAESRKSRTARESHMAQALDQSPLRPYYAAFRQKLHADLPSEGLLDLTPIFDSQTAEVDVFIDGCHFGDRGNDLIARALHEHVQLLLKRRRSTVRR